MALRRTPVLLLRTRKYSTPSALIRPQTHPLSLPIQTIHSHPNTYSPHPRINHQTQAKYIHFLRFHHNISPLLLLRMLLPLTHKRYLSQYSLPFPNLTPHLLLLTSHCPSQRISTPLILPPHHPPQDAAINPKPSPHENSSLSTRT